MYVDIRYLFWGIIGLAIIVALSYLILTFRKISNLLDNVNATLNSNKENINKTLTNISDITGNVKDISDAATDVTADVIVAKENLLNNMIILKDILSIISSIFKK